MRIWRVVLVLSVALMFGGCGGDDPPATRPSGGSEDTGGAACPSARHLRGTLLANGAFGDRPGAEVFEGEAGRPMIMYRATDGSDHEMTYGDFVAASEKFARQCARGVVATDIPIPSKPHELETRCFSPKQIRQRMLIGRDPEREARYLDAEDVLTQGITGGPGYQIVIRVEYGQQVLLFPIPNKGEYPGIYVDNLEPGLDPGDTTFTRQQFIKYSKVEARRCLRET